MMPKEEMLTLHRDRAAPSDIRPLDVFIYVPSHYLICISIRTCLWPCAHELCADFPRSCRMQRTRASQPCPQAERSSLMFRGAKRMVAARAPLRPLAGPSAAAAFPLRDSTRKQARAISRDRDPFQSAVPTRRVSESNAEQTKSAPLHRQDQTRQHHPATTYTTTTTAPSHPSNPPSHRQSETPRADVLRLPPHHPSVLGAPAQSRLASCLPSGAGPRGADLLLPLARGFPIIYSTKFLRPPRRLFSFPLPLLRTFSFSPSPSPLSPSAASLCPTERPPPPSASPIRPRGERPAASTPGLGETPTPSVERAARGAPHGAT